MAQPNISIASLFGITPEEYKYQRAQNDLDTITTAAPKSGVDQLFMLAGRQAGRAVGGMLGSQDPTLTRITKINAVGKMVQDMGVDPSNPDEVYPAMIKGFQQAGLMQEAMMASQQYQALQMKRQEQIIERQKAQAALTNAMNKKTENDPSLLKSDSPFIIGAKYVLGKDITRTTDLNPEEFKVVKDWADNYMKDMPPEKDLAERIYEMDGTAPKQFLYQYRPEQVAAARKSLLEDKKQLKPETKVENKVTVHGQKNVLDVDQKMAEDYLTQSQSSIKTLQSLGKMAETYKGGVVTGSLADTRVNFLNVLDTLGFTTGKDKQVLANSEDFAKEAQRLIGSVLKAYGYNPSNVDLQAAQKSMPNLANSPQGLVQLINGLIEMEQMRYDEAERALEHYRNNDGSFKGFKRKLPSVSPIMSGSSSDRKKAAEAEARKRGLIP